MKNKRKKNGGRGREGEEKKNETNGRRKVCRFFVKQ